MATSMPTSNWCGATNFRFTAIASICWATKGMRLRQPKTCSSLSGDRWVAFVGTPHSRRGSIESPPIGASRPFDKDHNQRFPWSSRRPLSVYPKESSKGSRADELVARAIASLTPQQRAALLLREVEGLTYEQIAKVLGVSVAAVKSRLNRARMEIALAMEVHDD